VEAGDLEGALRLLDLGIAQNPDDWILPYMAGWECFHAGEFARASEYFAAASEIPGAPYLISRNRAGAIARSGNIREAYRLWRELYEDPNSDETTRVAAEKQVRELHIQIDLQEIHQAVDRYRERHGRFPPSIGDLVAGGLLSGEPRDPDGNPYGYNPNTGKANSVAGRILGDR
jgi:tetratricopeptide (TPR) repeat protein